MPVEQNDHQASLGKVEPFRCGSELGRGLIFKFINDLEFLGGLVKWEGLLASSLVQ